MLIFWIILVVIILIGAAITAAIAEEVEYRREVREQMAFVQWLCLKGYTHFRVLNETYTKSFKQKAKNKALGVSSGVPDLFVVVPRQQELWNGIGDEAIRTGNTVTVPTLVAIEMKRKKGGTTSANQKQWLQTLNEAGIQSVVCKGCDEAIKFIESITKSEECSNARR